MLKKHISSLLHVSKSLFFPSSLFHFSVESETSPIIDSISDNLISEKPLSKPRTPPSEPLNQPKWMRFFTASEPLKIDLERSIKNENNDMIMNYVRINYLSFDFQQLVLSLEKRLKPDLSDRLFHEIKLRIANDTEQKTPEILISLLNYSMNNCVNDDLMAHFLACELLNVACDKNLKFEKLLVAMRFFFALNRIEEKTLEAFLMRLEEWKKTDKIKEFSLNDLNNLMIVVKELKTIMKKKNFDEIFDRGFLDKLFNELLEKIDWFSGNQRENREFKVDLKEVQLIQSPDFFTFEQRSRYKLALARILFEKLNEEANFGRFNSNRRDKIVLQNYFLTHFTFPDRYLLKETLQLLCQTLLKDQSHRRNPTIFSVLSTFSIICPFFFNEALSYFQSHIRKMPDYQAFMLIRSYYEANYDEILQGVAGNEYLRTSWELVNKNVVELLTNYFNAPPKKERFLRVLTENLKEFREKASSPLEKTAFANENNENRDEDNQIIDKSKAKLAKYRETLEKIPKLRDFHQKISIDSLGVFKELLLMLDFTKNLAIRAPKNKFFKAESFSEGFKAFINESCINEFINKFPLIPSLAENLLFLENFYRNSLKKELFLKNSDGFRKLLEVKKEMDEIFNRNGENPLNLLKELKKREIDGQIQLEWTEIPYFSMEEPIFYIKQDKIQPKLANNPDSPFNFNIRVEDFYQEKFAISQKNISNKVIYSKILYFILNESLLKRIIWDAISKDSTKSFKGLKQNYVEFPAYCDFYLEYSNKKFAVFVMDHEKFLIGAENVKNPFILMCKTYFENRGVLTVIMNYQDYELDKERILDVFKIKLMERSKSS